MSLQTFTAVEQSIVDFARDLVRIPSQGGIDDCEPIIEFTHRWLRSRDLAPDVLRHDGKPVAVACHLGSGEPRYTLNACLDTAPIGDVNTWVAPPTSGEIKDGWLSGRGSADSKAAVSIFSHLFDELKDVETKLVGTLSVFFDGDEHTGRFAGVRSYLESVGAVDGVMIGYPGNYGIAIGARGFWRATLVVSGTGEHSGARKKPSSNAIVKASALVHALSNAVMPKSTDSRFEPLPKLTITAIRGGNGYSSVPDNCCIGVDLRLTPSFDSKDAESFVTDICARVDRAIRSRRATSVITEETWPPYRLPDDERIANALRISASSVFGKPKPFVVVGPSNIGNFLAAHGVPATCGFGVTYKNLHAPNERIELASITPVLETYRRALQTLLLS